MPKRKQKRTHITADENYTQFLKAIEPATIALVESHFRVDRDQYFHERSSKLSVAWKCTPTEIEEDYFEADAMLAVKLASTTGKPKPTIEIGATFRMHVHAPKPVNRAFVERFTDSEVRILLWPYFREYVSSVTQRMHIPPVVLPVGTRE